MKKVCARWVPRQLTDENRKRMGSVFAFLTRYEAEGNDYLVGMLKKSIVIDYNR